MSEKSLIIKNLCPGLIERGKIKIGRKGKEKTSAQGNKFQVPEKLDHFLVTTTEKDDTNNYVRDEEIHKVLGEKPTRIPVRLLYDAIDLNFQCRYACFRGTTAWCVGDGECATRMTAQKTTEEVPCPCERIKPDYKESDKCKVNGVLSVIIDGVAGVGGVWKFRTTGWNSTVGILSSLALIKRISGGPLAGLPLMMTLNPKTTINPQNKKAVKVWVVGLEYKGTIDNLKKHGLQIAMENKETQLKIENVEVEARKILGYDPVGLQVEAEDVAHEYYPEEEAVPEAVDPTAPPAQEPELEPAKPKRKRRTKAEIEADKKKEVEAPQANIQVEQSPAVAPPEAEQGFGDAPHLEKAVEAGNEMNKKLAEAADKKLEEMQPPAAVPPEGEDVELW